MLMRLWRYILASLSLSGESDAGGRLREEAVRAISQKHHLQQLVDDTRARVRALEIKAEAARQCGQEEQAQRMLREKQEYEQALNATLNSLEQASRTADVVKAAIGREEERIQQETRTVLRLRAEWKNSQLPSGMESRQITAFFIAVFLLMSITFCLLVWLKA